MPSQASKSSAQQRYTDGIRRAALDPSDEAAQAQAAAAARELLPGAWPALRGVSADTATAANILQRLADLPSETPAELETAVELAQQAVEQAEHELATAQAKLEAAHRAASEARGRLVAGPQERGLISSLMGSSPYAAASIVPELEAAGVPVPASVKNIAQGD